MRESHLCSCANEQGVAREGRCAKRNLVHAKAGRYGELHLPGCGCSYALHPSRQIFPKTHPSNPICNSIHSHAFFTICNFYHESRSFYIKNCYFYVFDFQFVKSNLHLFFSKGFCRFADGIFKLFKMKKYSHSDEPIMVSSHNIHLDEDYAEWIAELKHRYRSAQVKAAVKVNAEKLLFNWQLGRDLVQKKAEERWGSGVVEQVSLDLRREFPNESGFSTRNLWYMKQWYLFYITEDEKSWGRVKSHF